MPQYELVSVHQQLVMRPILRFLTTLFCKYVAMPTSYVCMLSWTPPRISQKQSLVGKTKSRTGAQNLGGRPAALHISMRLQAFPAYSMGIFISNGRLLETGSIDIDESFGFLYTK